jgi:hypothetical protein
MKKGGQERVIDIHFAGGRATYDIKYVLDSCKNINSMLLLLTPATSQTKRNEIKFNFAIDIIVISNKYASIISADVNSIAILAKGAPTTSLLFCLPCVMQLLGKKIFTICLT